MDMLTEQVAKHLSGSPFVNPSLKTKEKEEEEELVLKEFDILYRGNANRMIYLLTRQVNSLLSSPLSRPPPLRQQTSTSLPYKSQRYSTQPFSIATSSSIPTKREKNILPLEDILPSGRLVTSQRINPQSRVDYSSFKPLSFASEQSYSATFSG